VFHVENAVLLSDVAVGPGAVLKDCIVGANATIGLNVTVEGGHVDVVLGDTVHRDVRFDGIGGDNSELHANVSVTTVTTIGDDATVGSGSVVRSVDSGGKFVGDNYAVRRTL